jgi:hypothetical protein
MANGVHGSLNERRGISGNGDLVPSKSRRFREALAHELQEHLVPQRS